MARHVRPLKTSEAAKYLGVSESTMRRWRRDGVGPAAIVYEPGRTVRYELWELDRFKAASRRKAG